MPYHLELGSDGHKFMGKAIVVNTITGHHYSNDPIPLKKAEAQLRVLEQAHKEEKKNKHTRRRRRTSTQGGEEEQAHKHTRRRRRTRSSLLTI